MLCTCGPCPVVDATSWHGVGVGVGVDDVDDERRREAARDAALRACRDFGCFHVVVGTAPGWGLGRAADDVERCFDDAFVRARCGGRAPRGVHRCTSRVTFRGREAESGGRAERRSEPKRSWEFRRGGGERRRRRVSSRPEERWARWERESRAVAATLSEMLRLPSGVVAAARDDDDDDADLLRAFRYDAVPASQREKRLGSSPHTDWGSLTVVWQDDVGGLQTYCRAHDAWNDVPAPSLDDQDDEDSDSSSVRLFVHVGDFLSLSTRGRWPSPRHRVVCHPKSKRSSLVYFSYPSPGLSLAEAQRLLKDGDEDDHTNDDDDDDDKIDDLPLETYSLLENQEYVSNDIVDDKNEYATTYRRIRTMPFDEVIQEKWNQVQRT